jgi:cyclopropane fatty-acyl-phospholipid synthase-like methyltransferase
LPSAAGHVQCLHRTDEEQVRDHYDRGDDFYGWFLGPRMIYTSGVISDINKEESLEQLQDNKMGIVCEKIDLKEGERMLDIGCGWGTLARFASVNYGASVTGVTLGRNQTAWGNNGLRKSGIEEDQSKILCMDYRDIPVPEGKFNKITCLEMAEHVGVRHLGSFFRQVYDMLDDDGVFFLQIAGLRKDWQFEDFTWGLFMNKYVFPGADASTPLGFVVDTLEGAGFEVKMVDTIGVHYSATLWRWYRNWLANKDKVTGKYGKRWFRVSLLCGIPIDQFTDCTLDLGILPRILHDRLPPGYRLLLPNHSCKEPQRRPPH